MKKIIFMRNKFTILLLSLFLFVTVQNCFALPKIQMSRHQAAQIGKKVWQNEAQQKIAWLTWWNKGEDFASMGIGHFIWYPDGVNGPFYALFPQFLAYAKSQGARLPSWLADYPPCPWSSRKAFMAAQQSKRMVQLRQFLANNIELQAEFMIYNVNQSLPSLFDNVSGKRRNHIRAQLNHLINTRGGNYAIVDYINFKGMGTYPSERYHGQGWGLLQVLENMHAHGPGPNALHAFVASAKKVLRHRVANAPASRHEIKWLPGWIKRVKTYA